ncbi:hypothetical protein [Buttiauxella gaviniae]|uniref:hypothetical protein n=1 Tax=Buttiauxella gaviniae TaxID=82990 RepID=UPI0039AF7A77
MNNEIMVVVVSFLKTNWLVPVFFFFVMSFYGAVSYVRIKKIFTFYHKEYEEIAKYEKVKYTKINFINRSKKYISMTIVYIFITIASFYLIIFPQLKFEKETNNIMKETNALFITK